MADEDVSEPWLEFERVAAEIQRQLAPNATVRHNERIVGKSGVERKVDITVRQSIGPYPVLIAFDCKRHSRPVPVADVGAFAEQVEDIGASVGVIISNRGFTDGAVKVAAGRKMVLQTLREAQQTDWQELVGANAWVNLSRVEIRDLRYEVLAERETHRVPDAPLHYAGGTLADPTNLFLNTWNALPVPRPLGSVMFDVEDAPLFTNVNGERRRATLVRLLANVFARVWVVNLNLANGQVLSAEPDRVPVYQRMTSASFEWKKILDEEPGLEITEQELAEIQSSTALNTPLDGAKRYLRVVVTKARRDSKA